MEISIDGGGLIHLLSILALELGFGFKVRLDKTGLSLGLKNLNG